MGYKQIGNACGAYSLSLVRHLIHDANWAPQELEWHANAVGKEYWEYYNRPDKDKDKQPKPAPGGLYGEVKYSDKDGPDDPDFKKHLLDPGYSSPLKMVAAFDPKHGLNGWQAQVCYNSEYDKTNLLLVQKFLEKQLALLESKGPAPARVDIVESIKNAAAGKSYASIVLISFMGEAASEIAGLHFVTLRKTAENKLEIYDSNSDTFAWHDQLTGTHYADSKPVDLNTLKVGDAFKSCSIPYCYTGFGILYSKS